MAFLPAVFDGYSASRPGAGILLAVYLPVVLAGILQYRSLTKVPAQLRTAVLAYMIVVSNLLAAGVLFAVTVTGTPLVLLGVAMIYLSDSLIAHNLFRLPLPSPQLWIMPTYYVGQIAVVLALLL